MPIDKDLKTQIKEYFNNFKGYDSYYRGPWKLVRERFVSAIRKRNWRGRKLNILDLGCGRSTSLPELLDDPNVITYTCVDFSSDSLDSLRSPKHPKLRIYDSDIVSFVRNCNDKFDIVILFGVVMYFRREEALELFSMINKVLSPGALILLHEPGKSAEGKIDQYSCIMTRDFLSALARSGRGLKIKQIKVYGILWLRRIFYFLSKGINKLTLRKQIILRIEDSGWTVENLLENIFSFFGCGSDYFIIMENKK